MAVQKKSKIDMVKTETPKELVTVELIGNYAMLQGEHTLFYGKSYIEFIDGIAVVTSTTADELRKLGQVK